jgi:hypothetical protein
MRRLNHRLVERGINPSKADRALCGELIVAQFANATGQGGDMRADSETVLSDLLADLMHWCDIQRDDGGMPQAVGFESALRRAVQYYREELGGSVD